MLNTATTKTRYVAGTLCVALALWGVSRWTSRQLEIARLEAAASLDAKANARALQRNLEDTLIHLLIAARFTDLARARELYISKVEEDPFILQLRTLDTNG